MSPRFFHKLKTVFIFLFYIIILLEIASRLYWTITKKISFFLPEAMYIYYPELKNLTQTQITKNDGYFDVLVLGGSVAERFEQEKMQKVFESRLREKISQQKFRFHILGKDAHSSMDSLFKYQYLKNKQFDLVVFYHGINDVRSNNAPPHIYREDYSHYLWYKEISFLKNYPLFKVFTLPFTVYYFVVEADAKMQPFPKYISRSFPIEQWKVYGKDVKSAKTFEKNIREIIKIARKKDEQLMLCSFAWYVPRDYTNQKFKDKQLDYGTHWCEIRVWGEPTYVIKGILAHNQVIRKLVAEFPEVIYADINAAIEKNKNHFDDICHLTKEGYKIFYEVIVHTFLMRGFAR